MMTETKNTLTCNREKQNRRIGSFHLVRKPVIADVLGFRKFERHIEEKLIGLEIGNRDLRRQAAALVRHKTHHEVRVAWKRQYMCNNASGPTMI
jgi:hypothetical protein